MTNLEAIRTSLSDQGNARQRQEARVAGLLSEVGLRVRKARTQIGLSRRELSDRSNVSQRYIAQLETGHGNISIALLLRLGDALDLRVEELVAENTPWQSDCRAIAHLLQSASKDQLRRVRAILDPEHPSHYRKRRIALIGLRGAGKSTLGRLAAEHLDLPFLELNEAIEQASGMAVTEVIALYGQEGYRLLEGDALKRIAADHDTMLLAVAGGIVSNVETFAYLLRHYHTIWLKTSPEEHMARVRGQGDERPMAGNPDAMGELRTILISRETEYARASATIGTAGRSVEQSLADLLKAIEEHEFVASGN